MAKQIIIKHYQRILAQWPTDLLRPTVSFQKATQHRIDTRLQSSPAAPSPDNVRSNQAQATVPTPVPFDEKGELEQVNVLYSFLENRYAKKYPLPESLMKPASRPNHYEELLRELEMAPSRSWWRARFNRWKGFIRWR